MDNTIDALKNLYVAMGGNIEYVQDIVIIPDMINAIAELMGGIMEHTGEMLEPFEIVLTATSETAGTSDKTAAEIMEAYEAGRKIVITGTLDGADNTLYPVSIAMKDGKIAICAIGIQEPTHILMEAMLPWSDEDDNSWVLAMYTLTPVE